MLDISTHKVAQVILMARELERAEGELRAFIERLSEDEQISLVALMWIGRDSFARDEVEEAKATAREEQRFNEGGGVRQVLTTSTTAERLDFGGKFRQNILDQMFWYAMANYYRNQPSGINSRVFANGGIGYRFMETPNTLLAGELGLGVTRESRVDANGETFVHEAYALGFGGGPDDVSGGESTPERQALRDFVDELVVLASPGPTGDAELFEPSEYGIEALVVDDLSVYGTDGIEPTVVDWPTGAAVGLADASTCTVVPAAEVGEALAAANQLTFFTDADVTYQVFAKPILPGTVCG